MTKKYFGEWANREQVDYEEVQSMPEDSIVYACYNQNDYDGEALVVFEKDGKLYENHDSHCSCYGLDHWAPEVAEFDAMMKYDGWYGLQDALLTWRDRQPVLRSAGDPVRRFRVM